MEQRKEMEKSYLLAGAVFILTSIVLGAFGSHALRPILPENTFYGYTVATTYLSFQGLALLVLGLLQFHIGSFPSSIFYYLFFGTVVFSGSILILTVGKLFDWSISFVGPFTPIGGLLLIIGWALLIRQLLSVEV